MGDNHMIIIIINLIKINLIITEDLFVMETIHINEHHLLLHQARHIFLLHPKSDLPLLYFHVEGHPIMEIICMTIMVSVVIMHVVDIRILEIIEDDHMKWKTYMVVVAEVVVCIAADLIKIHMIKINTIIIKWDFKIINLIKINKLINLDQTSINNSKINFKIILIIIQFMNI